MRKTLYTVLTALLLLSTASTFAAQDSKPAPKSDAKAEEIIRKAVEAVGGAAYLDVRTIVSRGYFSQYHEGRQLPPLTFTDYLAFPDRERTEFKGGGTRMVQTNTGETGWVYEGQSKKITDVTPAQAEDFRTAMRTSLDNILRGWWRKEGASLAYVGRREAGLAMRNEAVRLTYPDGFEVEFEFGAREFLPAKALYKKKNAEGETVEEEDRYAQFLYIGSVRVPFVVDHYRAGTQSSRVNFDKVEFNVAIPDALFAKPIDPKALLKSLK
ncbi:MAG TPA: hypothetical protein VGX48_24390 [Pyrinomonadaceae bacterium]|jgi:outer membrane lipoprotein-sorting protein|nr:hypothetical protein [Pyrinomonadaceae bacterium]